MSTLQQIKKNIATFICFLIFTALAVLYILLITGLHISLEQHQALTNFTFLATTTILAFTYLSNVMQPD